MVTLIQLMKVTHKLVIIYVTEFKVSFCQLFKIGFFFLHKYTQSSKMVYHVVERKHGKVMLL